MIEDPKWLPCKLCNVVQPPRALGEDGCCKDTAWCIKQRHRPEVPSNGAHKVGSTKYGEVPVQPAEETPKKETTNPGTPAAKAKSKAKGRKK